MSEALRKQYGEFNFEDEQDRGTDLLPEVFKNSENIKKVINIFMKMIQDLHDAGQDIYSKISIYEAEGSQLDDIFGNMLDVKRLLGEQDGNYRNRIIGKTAILARSGEILTMKDVYRTLLESSDVRLFEYYPHTFIIDGALDDISLFVDEGISDIMKETKMGGVTIGLTISDVSSPFTISGNTDDLDENLGFSGLSVPTEGGELGHAL